VEYHSRAWEITSEDTLLTAAPVSHAQGMHNGVGSAFLNYCKYVITDSTDAGEICKVIEREKVTPFHVPASSEEVNLENLGDYDCVRSRRSIRRRASTPELVRSVYEKMDCKFVTPWRIGRARSMTRLNAE